MYVCQAKNGGPLPAHSWLLLAIFGFTYFLFLPRPLYLWLAKYDYSKSQLFIFMCFYARKVWTERLLRSWTVPYQLLIVDNKRISFATGVSEETEKNHQAHSYFSTKKGDCSEASELTRRNRNTFGNFLWLSKIRKKKPLHLCNLKWSLIKRDPSKYNSTVIWRFLKNGYQEFLGGSVS